MTLQLLRSASEASSLFDTHALQARQTERIQIDVSRSTTQLAEAIKQMTASTHEEMRKINETATTLKISLSETSDLRTPSEFMGGGFRALFSFSRDCTSLVVFTHMPRQLFDTCCKVTSTHVHFVISISRRFNDAS